MICNIYNIVIAIESIVTLTSENRVITTITVNEVVALSAPDSILTMKSYIQLKRCFSMGIKFLCKNTLIINPVAIQNIITIATNDIVIT